MEQYALWSFSAGQTGRLLSLGMGTAVSCLVYLAALYVARRRQVSMLDVLLFRRSRKQSLAPPEEDVPNGVVTPEALKYLKTPEEDLAYLQTAPERRTSVRRWGNPVEVQILSRLTSANLLRGVIINRSTGGLAILVDDAYDQGDILTVRAAQAPPDVSGVDVEVRSCREAGRNWVIGCKYTETPAWNAVAWFG
jgi:hypothetical protein